MIFFSLPVPKIMSVFILLFPIPCSSPESCQIFTRVEFGEGEREEGRVEVCFLTASGRTVRSPLCWCVENRCSTPEHDGAITVSGDVGTGADGGTTGQDGPRVYRERERARERERGVKFGHNAWPSIQRWFLTTAHFFPQFFRGSEPPLGIDCVLWVMSRCLSGFSSRVFLRVINTQTFWQKASRQTRWPNSPL